MLNTVVILVLIFILFKLQDIDINLQEINFRMKYLQQQGLPEEHQLIHEHQDVVKPPIPLERIRKQLEPKVEPVNKDAETVERNKKVEEDIVIDDHHDHGQGKVQEIIREEKRPTAFAPLGPNQKTYLSELEGVNRVVMSLWGKNYKYTTGALRNAELIKDYFPGWKLRVYVELPSDSPVHELVPNDVLDKLTNLGTELNFVDPKETKIAPMMWRFMVVDDMSVDRFIIRDSDSRLSARDAATVAAWVKSGKPLHCVRDHPSHSMAALSGGMWGGVPSSIRNLMRRPFKQLMYGFKSGYGEDMNFLNSIVWPRLKDSFYCSDSVSCDRYPSSHSFPIPRYTFEHVGQVFDDHDLARPVDVQILRQSKENYKCSPAKQASQE